MQVVLNRVRHPAFPSSVCGVVYQGSDRATGCQFTFTCDGAMARRPMPWLWARSREIAAQALTGKVYAKVGLATHYHTDWVIPDWSGSLDKIARVDTHLFFRWKGYWGRPRAFVDPRPVAEPSVANLASISPPHQMVIDPQIQPSEPERADVQLASAGALASALPPGVKLRGAELRIVHPQGDAFGFLLPRNYPGSFGLLALDVCKGRTFCKVMGWTDVAAIPKGFPLSPDARRQMVFLHIHDGERRQEMTAWNCDLFPRSDKTQCLSPAMTRWDAVIDAAPAG